MDKVILGDCTLILGDCLEVMKEIPEKSVNLICTDPPYNIGKADWDKIPNYIEWCGKWTLECQRVLADNGSFYFSHNDMEQVADLIVWIRKNTSFVFKQFIVWNKRFDDAKNKGFLDGFVVPDGLRNYQQMAEYYLFYTFQDETGLTTIFNNKDCFGSIKNYLRNERKKSGLTLDEINVIVGTASMAGRHYFADSQWCMPIKEHYEKLQSTGFFGREYEDLRREYEDLRYTFNNQKTHHSVWDYEIAKGNGHVTPKPVDLIENIIKHSSNKGDTVLDLFMGYGSCGEACVNLNRKFIGIDNDITCFDYSVQRIKDAQQQMRLPL